MLTPCRAGCGLPQRRALRGGRDTVADDRLAPPGAAERPQALGEDLRRTVEGRPLGDRELEPVRWRTTSAAEARRRSGRLGTARQMDHGRVDREERPGSARTPRGEPPRPVLGAAATETADRSGRRGEGRQPGRRRLGAPGMVPSGEEPRAHGRGPAARGRCGAGVSGHGRGRLIAGDPATDPARGPTRGRRRLGPRPGSDAPRPRRHSDSRTSRRRPSRAAIARAVTSRAAGLARLAGLVRVVTAEADVGDVLVLARGAEP